MTESELLSIGMSAIVNLLAAMRVRFYSSANRAIVPVSSRREKESSR